MTLQIALNGKDYAIDCFDGWWQPSPRSSVIDRYQRAGEATLPEVIERCRGRSLVVQAGGHLGTFARMLAGHFDKVLTFEPDPVNWACLQRNVANDARIIASDRALSDREELAPWGHSDSNSGKNKISQGSGHLVRTVTIDGLDLPACSAIVLDVEGYELPALRGAANTIAEHSPVVLFEDIGHGRKYGFARDGVQQWLSQRGYAEVARVFDDRVWSRS